VIEKEERRWYGLRKEDVGLQLPWMGTSDGVARSWEEMGIDEFSNFEREKKQRGNIDRKGRIGWSDR
jgi:hypothetical protein